MGGKRPSRPDRTPGSTGSGGDAPDPGPASNEDGAAKLGGPAQRTVDAGKILIVHDDAGQIVAVTRTTPGARNGVSIELEPGNAMIELDGASVSERLTDLHDHYAVNVEDGTLVKKTAET